MEEPWISCTQDFHVAPLTILWGFPTPARCCCFHDETSELWGNKGREKRDGSSMSLDAALEVRKKKTTKNSIKTVWNFMVSLLLTSVSQVQVCRVSLKIRLLHLLNYFLPLSFIASEGSALENSSDESQRSTSLCKPREITFLCVCVFFLISTRRSWLTP